MGANPMDVVARCVESVSRDVSDVREIARRCSLYSVYTAYVAAPRIDVLKKWFESLSDEEKCVLTHRWRGSSIRRAAEVCGVSVSRARSILRKWGDPFSDSELMNEAADLSLIEGGLP